MLARRSRPQAGVPDLTQGSRPAAGGQHERALRGPRELRLRVHRLSEADEGNFRLILELHRQIDLAREARARRAFRRRASREIF